MTEGRSLFSAHKAENILTGDTMKEKNKIKKDIKRLAVRAGTLLLAILIGFAGGWLIGALLEKTGIVGAGPGRFLLRFLYLVLLIYIAFFLQGAFHEAGHLICGLMSGYGFSSYRIGSLMWIRQEGKIRFKRFSLAGTGGQCLMTPPELTENGMPYVLYNLGGVLMNFLTAALCLCFYCIWRENWYLSAFLILMALTGIWLGAVNGIPLKLGMVNNDGRNIVDIGKNKDELRAFWLQMNVAEQQAKGARLKDMPAEWFRVPAEEKMKYTMTSVCAVLAANRLMDEHAFEETAELIAKLLKIDSAMIGIYRFLLTADRIYCELLGERRGEILEQWEDRQTQRVVKQMKNYLSVIRTEYAYALLKENNIHKAETLRDRFEKNARSYPYAGDAQSERELMDLADEKWQEKDRV